MNSLKDFLQVSSGTGFVPFYAGFKVSVNEHEQGYLCHFMKYVEKYKDCFAFYMILSGEEELLEVMEEIASVVTKVEEQKNKLTKEHEIE